MEIVRLTAPDADYVALLDATRFGHRGLRFRRTNWADVAARWQRLGAAFIAARDGGRTVGTYALVPHDVVLAGQPVRAWYRAGLAVAPEARGKGVGAELAAWVKREFVDAATVPTLSYGYVERDNEPSQRVQVGTGYAPIAQFVAMPVGALRPAANPAVSTLEPSERDALRASLATHWAGHVLGTDFPAFPDETLVLRESGRPVASLTGRVVSIDLEEMPGLRGRALISGSPLLSRLSPLFATRPNRHLWMSDLWWERPEQLEKLVHGALHRHGVAHGIVFVDERSPHAAALRALRGPVHRYLPAPELDVWAGWHGLSDAAIRALSDLPHAFSPADSA